MSELLLRAGMTADKASALGRTAFSIGVNFSILLTLCPAAICWIAFAVALAKGKSTDRLGSNQCICSRQAV